MKQRLALFVFAFLCGASRIHAERAVHLTPAQAALVLARVAIPDYPWEARRTARSGKGIFTLRFDYETGKLLEIHCAQSTGNGLLDVAAIKALKIWRAKPHTVKLIMVPIEFKQH